ncbi:RICIN domain-containing protein [Longispora sp. K20-0274]|uniref:RICIN domain-containing protein n=1 Tax=Longispora sp. K20-0274 TaxID=3088255 RepID=UPI00399A2971
MRSRTSRRSRTVLAALVPLALTVAAMGALNSPALAADPTYTITTGATGSYAYADDTAAYPLIDSDGKFYFQSSHSLYGATDSRKWNFWTGTDIDTGVTTAPIASAPDNANTKTRCNNSPTGLESTYDPRPTTGYSERNYCDLIGVWVDPDTSDWYGVVHNEFTPSPFGDGLHYDSIDYARSTDHGGTWTILDHIITSPFSTWRANDQLWTRAADGSFKVGGNCLDVQGGGPAAGTAVVKYPCNGGPNQKWTVTGSTLVHPSSGRCLTSSGTGAGATFTIQDCTGSATQTFAMPTAGAKGQLRLTGTPANCVDAVATLKLAVCNDPTKDGREQFPNQTYYFGDGDPKLFVDNASGYFYIQYDTQVLNQAGGGRVDLAHVARAPISAKMAPSSWKKWYGGTWTQPGVGGKEASLLPFDGTNTPYINDAYNPLNTGTTAQQIAAGQLPSLPLGRLNVAYDAYLGRYITMARPQSPTTSMPLHVYTTSDLATQKWVDIGTVADPSAAAWYRSLLDSTSKTSNYLVGKTFRDYCIYSCNATNPNAHWVATTIDLASGSLPTPPVVPGTAYQIAAGSGRYLAQSGGSVTTTATSGTSSSQAWRFTATGDGFFTIANVASGQNLGVTDTANSGRAWGAGLTLGTGSSVGMQWFVQTVTDAGLPAGSYRLVNRYSGQALSLTAGGAATAPQRDWTNPGAAGDTRPVNAQTLTFPAGTASANLIPAGNFEAGNLPGWTAHNATIVTDAAAHGPTRDLRLASGAGDYATMEYTVTGLSPNTAYTYTGWVRADSGLSTSFGVKNYGSAQVTSRTTATGWTLMTVPFTTGAGNTTATVFCYLPSASATSTCDDLSLTAG